ncbi:hypothetical protein RI367_003538 [Sorochytrium milnesiophthora]
MVKVTRGVLIKCDPTVKQIILMLHEQEGNKIIQEDLDGSHIIVFPKWVDTIKARVEQHLEQNTYKKEEQ